MNDSTEIKNDREGKGDNEIEKSESDRDRKWRKQRVREYVR